MRIYYIFKINDVLVKEFKNNPLNLYEALEKIYMLNSEDLGIGLNVYKKITKKINKDLVNTLLKDIYFENVNYTNRLNVHSYYDYLKKEESRLFVNNSYIKIKTNVNYPIFLNDIKNMKNIFVCDFINMDYFWLKELTTSLV